MKKLTNKLALLLILFTLPLSAAAAEMLIPVGQVVGLELGENRVCVAAFDETIGKETEAAGLRVGDEIQSIDGRAVHTAQDVQQALEQSKGIVSVEVLRDGKTVCLRLSPAITGDGPRLGVYLRQGVTGIGTVTWYDPESGQFGALGHGVNTTGGALVDMVSGNAYAARIQSVKPGKVGQPGQLIGAITNAAPIGTLERNTAQGIFGTVSSGWSGQALPVCDDDEIRTGTATIWSTINGDTPQEYSVEILKIYPDSREDGRNMLIRITDPRLLTTTGGIVQGMSGSPILQDGRIVGAVTHVLVNDPTTGYGIFIENMLDAAR